jgi:crotonobetainyl-CoA:carnitine CoA-transferase CaiB-like acyl-CoA transferase
MGPRRGHPPPQRRQVAADNRSDASPVQTEEEVLRDAQAEMVGAFIDIEHPGIPGCRVVNSPAEFGPGPQPPYRHAPELGAHAEEVALEAGLTWEDIAKAEDAGVISWKGRMPKP